MHMTRHLPIIILLILLTTACRQQQISSSDITLDLTVSDMLVGDTTLLITVLDTDGNVIQNPGKLSLRGDMDHAGMVPVFAESETSIDGVFTLPFEWTMAGGWIVEASLNLDSGAVVTQSFNLEIMSEAGAEAMDGMDHSDMDHADSATDMTDMDHSDMDHADSVADMTDMDHSDMDHADSAADMTDMDHSDMDHADSAADMTDMDHSDMDHADSAADMTDMDHSDMGHADSAADMTDMDHSDMAGAAVSGQTSAAYLHIDNRGASDVTITAARSAAAMAVEFHQTIVENDIARMQPVSALSIPAGQSLHLHPGGMHIMLIDLMRDLTAGSVIAIELVLESGDLIALDLPIMQMQMDDDAEFEFGNLVFSQLWARPASAGAMRETEAHEMSMEDDSSE